MNLPLAQRCRRPTKNAVEPYLGNCIWLRMEHMTGVFKFRYPVTWDRVVNSINRLVDSTVNVCRGRTFDWEVEGRIDCNVSRYSNTIDVDYQVSQLISKSAKCWERRCETLCEIAYSKAEQMKYSWTTIRITRRRVQMGAAWSSMIFQSWISWDRSSSGLRARAQKRKMAIEDRLPTAAMSCLNSMPKTGARD